MIRSPPVTRKFNGSATPTTANNVTTPVNGNNNVNNVLSPPMGVRSRSRSPAQRKHGQEMGNGIDKVRFYGRNLLKNRF